MYARPLTALVVLVSAIAHIAMADGFVNYTKTDVTIAMQYHRDTLWVGTTGGVLVYDQNDSLCAHYTTADGLADNSVYDIGIDSTGQKWFATGAGLSRFDGTSWHTFTADNSGLKYNYVHRVAVDHDNTIWTNTYRNIYALYGNNWVSYDSSHPDLPAFSYANDIVIARNNTKWFCTNAGVFYFNGSDWGIRDTTNTDLPGNSIMTMAFDGRFTTWYLVKDLGVSTYTIGWTHYTSADGLASNGVQAIAIDSGSNEWVATKKGVSMFNGTNWHTYDTSNSGLEHEWVDEILYDRNNRILCGTRQGVSILDSNGWHSLYRPGGPRSNFTQCIRAEENGDMWIGTARGVSELTDTGWVSYTVDDIELQGNYVHSITMSPDGTIWFGTERSGLVSYDGDTWQQYSTSNSGILDNTITSVTTDEYGNLWMGVWTHGISVLHGSTWHSYTSDATGLCSDMICDIFIDDQDRKWFATSNGISRYDGSTWVSWDTSDGLAGMHVKCIARDSSGTMWFGTDHNGVCSYTGDGVWTTYDTSTSALPWNAVVSITVDADNNVWCGTWGKGVSVYDGADWTTYTQKDGLADNRISEIYIDHQGTMWFSTNNGLSKRDDITPIARPAHVPHAAFSATPLHCSQHSQGLVITSTARTPVHVRLYTLQGRCVRNRVLPAGPAGTHHLVSTTALARGSYLVHMRAGAHRTARKIVLE